MAEEKTGRDPSASSGKTPQSADAEVSQPEIDERLQNSCQQAGEEPRVDFSRLSAVEASAEGSDPDDAIIGERDVEFLLDQAQQALDSIDEAAQELPPGVKQFELDDFSGASASSEAATLDLVRDVELNVNIELGRTHMHLQDVLRLKKGSVVPLDKLAGDPVDIYVNDRLIARGEVLVLDDNFCVRVAELVVGDRT